MSGEEAQLGALLPKLTAAGCSAYSLTTLDAYKATNAGSLPTTYTEVHVMERYSPAPFASGLIGSRYYRVLLRQVAQKYVNAQRERDRATTALEGSYVTVAGRDSTVISRAVSDDPIGPDGDGWVSGTSEFTYAI